MMLLGHKKNCHCTHSHEILIQLIKIQYVKKLLACFNPTLSSISYPHFAAFYQYYKILIGHIWWNTYRLMNFLSPTLFKKTKVGYQNWGPPLLLEKGLYLAKNYWQYRVRAQSNWDQFKTTSNLNLKTSATDKSSSTKINDILLHAWDNTM